MDEGLDPVEAVEASWRMTRGHVLKILGLGLMSIPIVIGGLILLIVGIFPALMWIKASSAALYVSINQANAFDPNKPIVIHNRRIVSSFCVFTNLKISLFV